MGLVSIVVPVYNEETNLLPLYEGIKKVLEKEKEDFEILFVDDGSEDGSFSVLREIHSRDPRVKVIRFSRNFGQTQALQAGFDHAGGEWVVALDADLQNDPQDIPLLLQKLKEGWDVVSGWRRERKDPFSRKIPSRIANLFISWVSGVKLHDYGCTLKAYRKEVLSGFRLYGEMHRFIPALLASRGASIVEVEVRHHPRRKGKSKYGFSRSDKVFLDLLALKFFLSFSTRPLHIFGRMGMWLVGGGFLSFGAVVWGKLARGIDMTGNPLLLLSVLLILIGVQLISLGLLAEIMVRVYYQARSLPLYRIKEFLR